VHLPSMDVLALADTLYSLSTLKISPGSELLSASAQRLLQMVVPSATGLSDPEALVNAMVALARWVGSAEHTHTSTYSDMYTRRPVREHTRICIHTWTLKFADWQHIQVC
jgi:hypothetical protein